MLDRFEYKISTNQDIDKFTIEKEQKLNSLLLDFKGGIVNKESFSELFENKLVQTKNLEKLELDFSHFILDTHAVEVINKGFKNMENLKELNLHISDTKLSNEQFDRLLNDSLYGKKTLNKIHLVMENVNITDQKKKSIEKLIESLPNLNHAHINLQRNKLSQNELTDLHNLIYDFPYRVLLW